MVVAVIACGAGSDVDYPTLAKITPYVIKLAEANAATMRVFWDFVGGTIVKGTISKLGAEAVFQQAFADLPDHVKYTLPPAVNE